MLYSLQNEGAGLGHSRWADRGATLHMTNEFFHPGTDYEREQVRRQLHKILASPAFQNSKRYAAVLMYVVEQTLQGNGSRLKERTIGIEVFHRVPDYDTATDHVVRSAAAEVRKRLAQYYLQDTLGELRIEVLSGSYVPQFRRAGEWAVAEACLPEAVPEPPERATAPAVREAASRSAWLRPMRIMAACAILAAAGAALIFNLRPASVFDIFWEPILTSRGPVLLCVGNLAGGRGSPEADPGPDPTLSLRDYHNTPSETINVHDAIMLAKFAGLMGAHGKQVKIVSQSAATYDDLQTGPAILVGLLNNDWTQSLLPKLRFVVEQPAVGTVLIRDRENPANANWSVNFNAPYLDMTRDYAIVLRMMDPKTEQTVVVAAGITVYGTTAAGNFLTSKSELRKLAAIAPPGWEKKNMEIVLSTDVIRGQSGPADVLAAQFW